MIPSKRAEMPGNRLLVTHAADSRSRRTTGEKPPAPAVCSGAGRCSPHLVRVGDDLYVRSWHGRVASWFRWALQRHQGSVAAGGVERAGTFEERDDDLHPAIHQAYRTKYGRYPDSYVRLMVEPEATAATFRLIPR